jgi:hypothetical protein
MTSVAKATLAEIRAALGAKGSNARCPAHDDVHASLSVSEGTDGKVLLKCHAGCSQEAVIGALRLRGLWPRSGGLTIAELAVAKALPESLLRESGFADDEHRGRPVVRMQYRGPAAEVICTRYRGVLSASGSDMRFWFRKGDKQHLFGLWRLQPAPVILVEGETDAMALWCDGFNALGVPGADAWHDARFAQLLEQCSIIYVHVEPDAGGEKFRAALSKSRLASRMRFWTVAPAAKDPCELRAKDRVGFKTSIEALLVAAQPVATQTARPAPDPIAAGAAAKSIPPDGYEDDPNALAKGKQPAESQASVLVDFLRERCGLVHDENGDVYSIDRETKEVRNIERRGFRNWLLAAYYQQTRKVARSQSVVEALQTLTGIGLHDGELVEVHIRCAPLGDGYVIDLGEPGKSRAIVVRPGSWSITEHHGVMFTRPDSMKPLPEPAKGGDLSKLWPLVNVPDTARLLVTTWLLDCLRPDTPHPLLEAIGEQGSAKSGLQALLKRLIDPSAIELRSAPRSGEDVFVGAGQGWLLAYDNVSHLSPDLQDVFCRVATGATYATRKLYTNSEESSIRAKRPVTLNGIGASITAQDLVDRAISLELPIIEDRREKASIEAEFDRLHPALLGALLDLFAAALSILPSIAIERDRRPRLIEFARLGCAVASAMGGTAETFLGEFEAMRLEAIGRTIDASPVAVALLEFLEERSDRYREYTVKELFEALYRPQGAEAWPKSPKGFADALRRAAPALRTFGVQVHFPGNRGGHARVTVTKRENSSGRSHASHGGGAGVHDIHDLHDLHDLVPASIAVDAGPEVSL